MAHRHTITSRRAVIHAGLWAWMLASSAAAENPERAGTSSANRLVGAATIQPSGKGFVSVGGSTLRYLAPGTRAWKKVHAIPGDNLYRVAVDPAGERVLASWEKDPFVHCFSLRTGRHLSIPRPPPPGPPYELNGLHSIAFSADGAYALIVMTSPHGNSAGLTIGYRAALDGSGPPEEMFRSDGGALLATGPYGAIMALPRSPKERCTPGECFPNASRIVAYEVSAAGSVERPLVTAEQVMVRRAKHRKTQDPDLVALELEHTRTGRSLLRYRPGSAGVERRELSPLTYVSQPTGLAVVARNPPQLVSIKTINTDLELHREALEGPADERIVRLASRHNFNSPLCGFGVRKEGSLWIHWGDQLALVDSRGRLTGVDLKPLAGAMSEWAGVDVYVEDPEALWIGVEVGSGRDYFRVRLADVDATAKPWPSRPAGCAGLPGLDALMRWPVQTHTCGGGMPNPRAPPAKPLDVVKVLPDGTKIIDAGERGCMRIKEEPCTKK